MKKSPTTILDVNRSPALHKPLPAIPLNQVAGLLKNNSLEDLSTQRSNLHSKG
jgi:hypothetical protein